jgi:hypothetical protein
MGRHAADEAVADHTARLDRAASRVRLALQEYLELYRGDDTATILEWAAAIEWSNPETERQRKAGRIVVCEPDRISQSTINGLGLFMSGMT